MLFFPGYLDFDRYRIEINLDLPGQMVKLVGASGGYSAISYAFHECVGYAEYVKHVACGGLVEASAGGVVGFLEV